MEVSGISCLASQRPLQHPAFANRIVNHSQLADLPRVSDTRRYGLVNRALADRSSAGSAAPGWPIVGRPDLTDDATWLAEALAVKIEAIDRQERSAHVMRFLRPAEAKSVGLCRVRLFQSHLTKLAPSIAGSIG